MSLLEVKQSIPLKYPFTNFQFLLISTTFKKKNKEELWESLNFPFREFYLSFELIKYLFGNYKKIKFYFLLYFFLKEFVDNVDIGPLDLLY